MRGRLREGSQLQFLGGAAEPRWQEMSAGRCSERGGADSASASVPVPALPAPSTLPAPGQPAGTSEVRGRGFARGFIVVIFVPAPPMVSRALPQPAALFPNKRKFQ